MATIPYFLAFFLANEELWILSALHSLFVSTSGNGLLHQDGTGSAVHEAVHLTFVEELALWSHFSANL